MKKLVTTLVALFFAASLMAQTATPPASGDGTGSNPHTVRALEISLPGKQQIALQAENGATDRTPQTAGLSPGVITLMLPNPCADGSIYTIEVEASPQTGGSVSGGGEYEHFHTVNLLATPAAGYEFQHWKEDDIVVMDQNEPAAAVYSFPAIKNRSLTAYFQQEGTSIPEVAELDDHLIQPGETQCFNATQTIYTGGDGGHFIVESGGSVTLIAGERIVMLQGTNVKTGGYLHAYIAPNGPFCGDREDHFLAIKDIAEVETDAITSMDNKDGTILNADISENTDDAFFKLYPNPTRDSFTIELHNYETGDKVSVEIFSMHGKLIELRELQSGQIHQFDLTRYNAGIYLVRVVQGTNTGIKRVMKQ